MAATFAVTDRVHIGNRYMTTTTITMDTDYASGGYAVAANDVGLGTIKTLTVHNISVAGYLAKIVASKVFVETVPNDAATGIDEAGTGDNALDGATATLIAIGT